VFGCGAWDIETVEPVFDTFAAWDCGCSDGALFCEFPFELSDDGPFDRPSKSSGSSSSRLKTSDDVFGLLVGGDPSAMTIFCGSVLG
jgi:hypothetical protein